MKTIAILTTRIDTFSNPTLTLIIEKLIDKNIKIIFIGYEQMFIPGNIVNKLDYYQLPFNFYRLKKNYVSLKKTFRQTYEIYKKLKIKNKVEVMICVDPMGLVIGGRIKKFLNIKLVYASFEIFSEEEFNIGEKNILKTLERKYSKKAKMVIIQDTRREKLLRDVNNFSDKTKFLHIPVSPKPITDFSDEIDIYKKLEIPEEKKIIIYSGTMQSWSGVNELINLFPDNWNSDYWLVIHSHQKINEGDKTGSKIRQFMEAGYQISFHNNPFHNLKDYAAFLAKCYAGIATYFCNSADIFAGKNLQEIGLSSGKFSTYMMLGIPTITTSNIVYQELNKEFNFGETINEMTEIPQAINKIHNDYVNKSRGCKLLYEKILNPVLKIENLINELNNLNKNKLNKI